MSPQLPAIKKGCTQDYTLHKIYMTLALNTNKFILGAG